MYRFLYMVFFCKCIHLNNHHSNQYFLFVIGLVFLSFPINFHHYQGRPQFRFYYHWLVLPIFDHIIWKIKFFCTCFYFPSYFWDASISRKHQFAVSFYNRMFSFYVIIYLFILMLMDFWLLLCLFFFLFLAIMNKASITTLIQVFLVDTNFYILLK